MKINILDCEWLTWSLQSNYNDRLRKKNQKKELIQIGIIRVDLKNKKILDKKNIYIKLTFAKKIPKRIIRLTGINETLLKRKGVKFDVAYKQMNKFIGKNPTITNGADEKVIQYNCILNKIKPSELNDKNFYNYRYFLKKNFNENDLSTENLIKIFKLKRNFKAHNALTDCVIIKNSIFQLLNNDIYSNNFKKFINV